MRVRGAASTFSGGTILPDGTPSLILDINSLP
jgi:chemotaxis protein histidine kinase CheA